MIFFTIMSSLYFLLSSMQHTIKCPACQMEHTFDEKYLGKNARCSCGEKIKLVVSVPETETKKAPVESEAPKTVATKKTSKVDPEKVLEKKEEVHKEALKAKNTKEVQTKKTAEVKKAVTKTFSQKTTVTSETKTGDTVLRPNLLSYMFVRLFPLALVLIGISLFTLIPMALLFGGIIYAVMFLVVAVILWVFFWLFMISYKKEKYIIKDTKIIREFWNIFSDNSTEVLFKRAAIIEAKRPFIQHLLFKTGYITIKAAGSSSSKFRMLNMKDVLWKYALMQEKLQENAFHLKKEKLVQTARPHFLGIFGELMSKGVGAIVVPIYVMVMLWIDLSSGELAELGEMAGGIPAGAKSAGMLAWVWAAGLVIAILGLTVFVKYMDLRKRRYNIFDDAVEYTEGFLSKHNAVIPMENVSDVENTQSFFSKIFGLHDIKVSCAGSGNDVFFKNMTSGEKMIENIKYLKDAIIPKKAPTKAAESKSSLVWYSDKTEQALKYNGEFKSQYKMNLLRAVAPFLVFLIPPLTPLGIAIIIGQFIRAKFTTYRVQESDIEKRFHFLSNKQTNYSIEKITGIVITENLIDKVFKTCSVRFLSLGSSGDMSFSYIKKTASLEKDLQEKIGVYDEGKRELLPVQFSFGNYIKANFITVIFLITIVLIPVVLVHFLYKKIYFSKKYYKNYFFNGGVASHKGIFIQTKEFALHRNIKGLISVKYPLTQAGKLVFNVAGEKIVQTNKKKGKSGGMLFSNTIKIPFLNQVQQLQDMYDERNIDTGSLDTTEIMNSKQAVINSVLISAIVLSVITAITFALLESIAGVWMLLLSAVIIGFTVWSIRVKYYVLQKSRAIAKSGIFYKKTQTILYEKFNFIELNRGFFNKIFKNGSVSVYTLWSGNREMLIQDIDSYNEFYDVLKTD